MRIDASQAKAAPGVIDVLTADDVDGDFKPVIPFSRMANYYATPILPLAKAKVRYVGEAIAAVIAESRYLAEDAVELINIEYEPLGAVSNPERNIAADAPLLHEAAGTNVLIAREFKKGDVKSDLAGAHVRVWDRFRMTRKSPLAMEPRSYSAEYESRYGSLTLYTSSNVPGIVRDALSDSLDLAGSRFRVVAPDVGGSFGSKGSLYPEEIIAACVAAKKLRRSVQWTADRLEDISSSSQAFAEVVDAEMGFDADGVAVALEADVIGDVGAYSIYPWTVGPRDRASRQLPARPVQNPVLPWRGQGRGYQQAADRTLSRRRPPDFDLRGRAAHGHGRSRAWHRPAGDPAPQFGARGRVSLSYRVRDYTGTEPASSNASRRAARAADYEKLRELQQAARAEGRYVGIGIASYAELTGIGSRIAVAPGMPINTGSETAKIRIDSTGAITAAFRRGFARSGPGDDAGANHRGRSRREIRRHPRHPGRQRASADVDWNSMRAGARCSAAARPSTHPSYCARRSSASHRICSRRPSVTSMYSTAVHGSLEPTVASRSGKSPRPSTRT